MTTSHAMPAGSSLPLLENERFMRLTLAKFLQLAAQNALVYGLFILVVRRQESSLATSAFVLTSVLPSILLSLPGGVLADALPRKLSLAASLVLRLGIAALFLFLQPGLAMILLLTMASWTVYQFYSPAESAALIAVCEREQLARATSLLQAVSLLAQLGGAGLLAPVLLELFGDRGLFGVVLVLLAASLLAWVSIPRLTPTEPRRRRRGGWMASMPGGLRIIRGNQRLLGATTLRVLLDSGFSMLVVAAPVLVADVLRAPPESTVYIVAPGALGLAAGLVLAPALRRLLPAGFIAWLGFALAVAAIFGLAFVQDVARALEDHALLPLGSLQDTFGVRRSIAATMLLLLPIGGLGVSLVQVASRALVYEEAPSDSIAQVFAAQSAAGSLIALLPTLLSGVLLDLLPVETVLLLVASTLALLAPFITLRLSRFETAT